MKKIFLLTMLMAAPMAMADDFNYEFGATYQKADIDLFETDALVFTGRYFFKPVDDSNGPLAEAAFLNKSSSVGLGYSLGENNFDATIRGYSVDGRYVTQGASLIFEATYSDSNYDVSFGDADIVNFNIAFGGYLGDVSSLVVRIQEVEMEDIGGDPEENESISTLGLELKRVQKLGNGDALNLEANLKYIDPDNSSDEGNATSFTFLVDYYLNNNFSAGVILGVANGGSNDDDADIYGVQAEYFFSNQIGMNGAFKRTHFNDLNFNADVLTVGIVGRF